MRDEKFGEEVAWASRPCFLAEELHGRGTHATSLPVLHTDFFSVPSFVSVSSVAPAGTSNRQVAL